MNARETLAWLRISAPTQTAELEHAIKANPMDPHQKIIQLEQEVKDLQARLVERTQQSLATAIRDNETIRQLRARSSGNQQQGTKNQELPWT